MCDPNNDDETTEEKDSSLTAGDSLFGDDNIITAMNQQRHQFEGMIREQHERYDELCRKLQLLQQEERQRNKNKRDDDVDDNDDDDDEEDEDEDTDEDEDMDVETRKIRKQIDDISKELQRCKQLWGEYELQLLCHRLRHNNDPTLSVCIPNYTESCVWLLPPGYGGPLGDALIENTQVRELKLCMSQLMNDCTEVEDGGKQSIASLLDFLRTTGTVDQLFLEYNGSDSTEQQQQLHMEYVTKLIFEAIHQNSHCMSTLECNACYEQWTAEMYHTIVSAAASKFRRVKFLNVKFASLTNTEQNRILSAYANGQKKESIYIVGNYDEGDCVDIAMDILWHKVDPHQDSSLDEGTSTLEKTETRSIRFAPLGDQPRQQVILQHVLYSTKTIMLRHLYIHRFHFNVSHTECLLEGLRQRNTVSSNVKKSDKRYKTVFEHPTMIQTLTFHSCTFNWNCISMLDSFMHAPVEPSSVHDDGIVSAATYVVLPELSIYENSWPMFGNNSTSIFASWLALQPLVSVINDTTNDMQLTLSSSPTRYSSTVGSQVQVLSVHLCQFTERFFHSFCSLAQKGRIQLCCLKVKLWMYPGQIATQLDTFICHSLLPCLRYLLHLRELHIGQLSEYFAYRQDNDRNDSNEVDEDDDSNDMYEIDDETFVQNIMIEFRQNCSVYKVQLNSEHADDHDGEGTGSTTSATPLLNPKFLSVSRFIEACCQRNQYLVMMLTDQQLSHLPSRTSPASTIPGPKLYTTMADLSKEQGGCGQDDRDEATKKMKLQHKMGHTETYLYPLLLRTACQIPEVKLSYILCSLLTQGDSIGEL